MPLAKYYEESEVSPDIRRVFREARLAFDSPFVPSLFEKLAGEPEYLKLVWEDLRRVACSAEFQAATNALQEFADSVVVEAGLRFTDQQRVLAVQKFSASDAELLRTLATVFARVMCQMTLFSRLLQRGYSGGQRGRATAARQAGALSRLMRLNIPRESDAGLRTWLIYADMRRVTHTKYVPGTFRVLSPYPSYLASLWQETKKMLGEPGFAHARDELNQRIHGLLVGLPVSDHRAEGKGIPASAWRDIEEEVDAIARAIPQYVIVCTAWRRSFTQFPTRSLAA